MRTLKPGEFQMPDECLNKKEKINFYKFWRAQWDWDGNNSNERLDTSGLKIRTYLIKRNLLPDNVNSEGFVSDTFKARLDFLELKLKSASKNCVDKKNVNYSDEMKLSLFEAFIAIQFWGGSEGRHVFENNFKVSSKIKKWNELYFEPYLKIIKTIKYKNKFKIKDIIEETKLFKNFKISFLSKHLHFWSIVENIKIKLPIYDSMVYDVLYAANIKQGQKNEHYDQYCQALIIKSKELNCGLDNIDLEKALFSYRKKIGVKRNNIIPKLYENQNETKTVNSFINSRMDLKKIRSGNYLEKNITINFNSDKVSLHKYKIIIENDNGEKYEITKKNGNLNCTCKSFVYKNKINCKHIVILLEILK
jgi:hypothetical protein